MFLTEKPDPIENLFSGEFGLDGSILKPSKNISDFYQTWRGEKTEISLNLIPCENEPKNDKKGVHLSLPENATIATEIFAPNGLPGFDQYEIVQRKDNPVVIDTYTGKVWLSGHLDFEIRAQINFDVRASKSTNPLIRVGNCYFCLFDPEELRFKTS